MKAQIRLTVKDGGPLVYFNPQIDIAPLELADIFIFIEVKVRTGIVANLSDDPDDRIYRHFTTEPRS